MRATKIRMQRGCSKSFRLEEIDSIFLVGCDKPGFYKKELIHNHLLKYPGTIQVNRYPFPVLIPEVSRRGEKYVRSAPNGSSDDNLLLLPRE